MATDEEIINKIIEDSRRPLPMEIAAYWAFHIKYPCGPELKPIYLEEARRALPILTPHARSFLEGIIRDHTST